MAVVVSVIADAIRHAGNGCEIVGDPDVSVSAATHDSRSVRNGGLFVCLRGTSFDGHDFAAGAVADGAAALLVEGRLDLEASQIVVTDTRSAAGPAASAVYGHPSNALTTVGITGTNGKTTTAQLLAAILDHVDESKGASTGIVGTLHGPRTTPEATDLQALLADFVDAGRTAAVMEVSSHALALHRVDGIRFDVVAFTNFGHDHLDLHGTPEEYFRAKSTLFDASFAPVAVIDVDDAHGRLLADTVAARTGADEMRVVEVTENSISDVVVTPSSHSYRWRGIDVAVPLGGDFNVAKSFDQPLAAAEIIFFVNE